MLVHASLAPAREDMWVLEEQITICKRDPTPRDKPARPAPAARQHGLRRVAHGGEDDPAGIDDGAVEVEKHDRVAHALDRSQERAAGSGLWARCRTLVTLGLTTRLVARRHGPKRQISLHFGLFSLLSIVRA